MRPVLTKLRPLVPIAAVALVLWLIFPNAFPTYDTFYALLWGDELARGLSPDYGAPLPPTPHPLADLWGALASVLGPAGASDATTVLAYLVLGAIAYLVYRLGELWFDRAIGVVAALIVLTRPGYLSDGLHAYVDLPYLALVLAALVLETRRPRAGWPVLALLAVAGLLRPEAWLFSAAYLAYLLLERDPQGGALALRRRPGIDGRILAGLVALAAASPILWALFDLTTAGDPLYSFTGTRDTVEALERKTGPIDLVLYGPRRLAEVLKWPGALGAAMGVALCLAFLPRRSRIGLTAVVLALSAFALLATAGLAIIPRYTMLAATLLAVFCAAALLGWRLVGPDHPWRRRWQLLAALTAVGFAVWIPNQHDELADMRTALEHQNRVEGDLHRLADSFDRRPRCGPISVPSYRAIPRLAGWLDMRPSQIYATSDRWRPDRGSYFSPASQFAVQNFLLDPGDPTHLSIDVPPGFRLVRANGSWRLYARCGQRAD